MRFPLILYFPEETNFCKSNLSSILEFSSISSDAGFSELLEINSVSVFSVASCSFEIFFSSEGVSVSGVFTDNIRFSKFCGKLPGTFGISVAIIIKPAFRSLDSFSKVSYCSGVAE